MSLTVYVCFFALVCLCAYLLFRQWHLRKQLGDISKALSEVAHGKPDLLRLSRPSGPLGFLVDSLNQLLLDYKRRDDHASRLEHAMNESCLLSITDESGVITYVNDAFCRLSKYSAEELLGQNHSIVSSGEHSEVMIKDLWTTILSGETWQGDFKNQCKFGQPYWVRSSIVPFMDASGRPYQFVAISYEVTQHKQMARDLEEAMVSMREQTKALKQSQNELVAQKQELKIKNDQLSCTYEQLQSKAKSLKEASEHKSNFLAKMSHDLRSPLNSLLILSQILADNDPGNLSHDQVSSAQMIQSSGQHLLKLINDVLDLSKIEAGKMTLKVESIQTQQFAQSLLDSFAPIAHKKSLRFCVNISEGFPNSFEADELRLQQVLKNLLANAFKFTDQGFVELFLHCPQDNVCSSKVSMKQALLISVKDSGVGVDPKDHQRIFSAFEQIGQVPEKGSGLGLAIADELVRLMGGELHLQSSLGCGSTFTLVLPQKQIHDSDSPKSPEHLQSLLKQASLSDPQNHLSGKKVLLVDDDLRNVFALSQALRKARLNVCVAENGKEALECLEQDPQVDFVLMDMRMPVMDGYEAMKKIRAQKQFGSLPIIACTAYAMQGDREKCLKAGANEYLSKPLNVQQLLNLMDGQLNDE